MVNILLFGGCNLRGPFMRLRRQTAKTGRDPAWSEVPSGVTFSGVPFMTYTVGEMIQAVGLYKGTEYIPEEIRALAGIPGQFQPNPRKALKGIDAIFIEPNTSIEIDFKGYCLNRNRVMDFLLPIRAISADMDKKAGQWYQKGIGATNDALRSSLAEAIIEGLPSQYPDLGFVMVFLRTARGVKREMMPAFDALAKSVDVPIGVITYTWQYMADGRPIQWPADFGKDVRKSAVALRLPLFDATRLVEEFGVTKALKADLRHYKEAFQPIVAKGLVEFAYNLTNVSKKRTYYNSEDA